MKTGKNTLSLDGNYAQEILSWYLWGQANPPSPSEIADARFIRKYDETTTLYVDAKEYMDKIGKNFPVARQIMFQLFFNGRKRGDNKNILGDPVSLEELKKGGAINLGSEIILNHHQFVEIFYGNDGELYDKAKDPKLESNQYKIDNNSDDYWMRSFAFGSTSFKLDVENVKYVFDANTGKPLRIDNFKIKPRSDNFDFISGNSFAMQINEILKQIMDPSGIGRKVNIKFDNNEFFTLPSGTSYTQNDYREYVKKHSTREFLGLGTYPDLPGERDYELNRSEFFNGLKKLHESDVYNFRDKNNRIVLFDGINDNIIQGTKGDNLNIANDIDVHYLGPWPAALADIFYDLEKFNKYRGYLEKGITYVGGDGNDTIEGTEYSDILKGNSGNDNLSGKEGDDQLEGGTGFDTYHIEGHDTVIDADSKGELRFGKNKAEYFIPETPNSNNSWISSDSNGNADGNFRAVRDGQNLVVLSVTNKSDSDLLVTKVTVKDYFNSRNTLDGALDIRLFPSKQENPHDNKGIVVEVAGKPHGYNVFNLAGGTKYSYFVTGGSKTDYLSAGSAVPGYSGFAVDAKLQGGNDIAYGTPRRDRIDGGEGTDLIFGSRPFLKYKTQEDKDLDNDMLIGNDGGDFIHGMAGVDVIYGGKESDHLIEKPSSEQGDWITGGEGNDTIFGSPSQDILQGGEGTDTIHAGANNDLLLGDGNIRPGVRTKTSQVGENASTEFNYNLEKQEQIPLVTQMHLNEETTRWSWAIDNEKNAYTIFYRGNMEDKVKYDSNEPLVAQGGAMDFLYGGAGDDMIIGQTGDDVLYGEAGDDFLVGDDTHDQSVIGNDRLYGGTGSDTLIGGKGVDSYYFTRAEMKPEAGKPAPIDVVIDDGRGDNNYQMDEIFLDDLPISSFEWNYDKKRKIWSDNDSGWQITKKGKELSITHKDYPGIIRVLDYDYGDYGLRLLESNNGPFPEPVPPQPEPPKPEQPKPEPKQPQAPTAGKPLAAQSIHEKDKLSYTLAEDTFHTANKDDKLSWSARLADGKPLPKWLNFDAATRTFSGTPGNDDVGTLDIEISVQGKGGSANQHFALNVINVNDAPYISAPFSLHSANSDGEVKCDSQLYIQDIDKDDKLTFSAEMSDGQPLPSWLSIDSETGVLTGILPVREGKDYFVRITATDKAGASASDVLMIRGAFPKIGLIGSNKDDVLKGMVRSAYGVNIEIHGYGGNDTIVGGNLHDDLYGDKGNDVLDGGSGNDIYHFARGDGNDIINNHDTGARRHDSIDFSDMNRSDFDIRREGNNLVLRSKDGKDQITVTNHFLSGWQIDSIRFADGITLDYNAINTLVSTQNPPQGNYTNPAAQALQMNQAIASLNSQAQPLDALATPDLQPRPLLAAGNP